MGSTPVQPPTPILDLESPLVEKRGGRRRTLLAIFVVVVPLIVGFWVIPAVLVFGEDKPAFVSIIRYFDSTFNPLFSGVGPVGPLVFFLFYMLGLFLIITIHELGHVAAGRAVGFHFKAIRIGPLQFRKSVEGMRVTIQFSSGFDGLAAVRIDKIRRLARRYAIVTAGGPLANFASALLIFAFLAIAPLGMHIALRGSLQLFAAVSIVTAILNLIPYRRHNGMYTDGGRLYHIARSLEKTRRLLCIIALHHQIDVGTPLKNFKRTWIAHACSHPDRSSDSLNGLWTAYLFEIAHDNKEQAARYLEQCLSRFRYSPLQSQKLMLMEAANFQAWFRDDAQKAELWFQKSERYAPAPLLLRLRVQIAMDWTRCKYDDAYKAWNQGRAQIESYPESQAKNVLLESWLEWKEQIDKRRAARESIC